MANFYKHIVTVHGIGEQQLNETGINFMNEFCRRPPSENGYKLTVKSLVPRGASLLVNMGQARRTFRPSPLPKPRGGWSRR